MGATGDASAMAGHHRSSDGYPVITPADRLEVVAAAPAIRNTGPRFPPNRSLCLPDPGMS